MVPGCQIIRLDLAIGHQELRSPHHESQRSTRPSKPVMGLLIPTRMLLVIRGRLSNSQAPNVRPQVSNSVGLVSPIANA